MEESSNERLLKRAENQVRLVTSVVEHGFSAVLIADRDHPDPRVVYVNPSFIRLTGLSSNSVVGKRLSAIPGMESILEVLRTGLPEGEHFLERATSYRTAEGERWGEWRVGPVPDEEGELRNWLVIFRDVTERKRLEKEILEISERERQRFGQDLHDGLCQHLAAVELMSQLLEQKLAGRSREGAERAREIAAQVRSAIEYARLLARGLSPVTLENEGLMSALRELAANTEKMFGVECPLESDVPVVMRDPTFAIHIYRIAQEAVSNAIKHGKAKRIRIIINKAGHESVLSIIDNGRGMSKPVPRGGMGLRIMEYRASFLGGKLAWNDLEPEGVEVVFTFPSDPKPISSQVEKRG